MKVKPKTIYVLYHDKEKPEEIAFDEAVKRLEPDYWTPGTVEAVLLKGKPLWTPFATYGLTEEVAKSRLK